MIEQIKEELIAKRKELEWKNNLRSLEVINWIDGLLKKIEGEKKPEAPKEVIVDLPDEEPAEEKKPAKKKIVFKKK